MKGSGAIPLATSASTPANGPGIGSMVRPRSRARRTMRIAGIGDHRHPGVAHQRQRLAALDARDQQRRLLVLVVLVIAVRRTVDAEMREQLARVPRVLAQDEIRGLQRRHRARRHVREIAERRADDEKFAHEAQS